MLYSRRNQKVMFEIYVSAINKWGGGVFEN